MSRVFYILLIFNGNLAFSLSEWVEISQNPASKSRDELPIPKIAPQYVGAKLRKLQSEDTDKKKSGTTPSPEWVAYQRERFQQQHSNSHQLVVSSGINLKKSARIIAPGSYAAQNTTIQKEKRHQIIHAKNRMEVKDDNYDKKVIREEPLPNVMKARVNSSTTQKSSLNANQGKISKDNEFRQYTEDEEYNNQNVETEQEEPKNSFENPLEYPSIQGFFKFITSLQKNLLRRTGFSIGSKIKVLKDLRDRFMRAIEERFMMLWQPAERKRSKRGLLDESSLSFPPDAALMSINFLTFAVFLIKLVLQVVQIVRSKHYSFTGLGTNSIPISKTTLGN